MEVHSESLAHPGAVYRVWIARFEDWRPLRWSETPPRAEAVEPAVAGCLTWEEAAQFVAGFNEASLAGGVKLWAVAAPVVVRYDGDFWPGAPLEVGPSPFEGVLKTPEAP
jgi:hypothetical protein